MRHLSAIELLDIVEHTSSASAHRAHLEACPACRDEAERIAGILNETRGVDVPEPSPLFWERFSTRVREAIDAEPVAPHRLPTWRQWPVLVPLTGLALLVVALAAAVAPQRNLTGSVTPQVAIDASALTMERDSAGAAEVAWVLIADLVGSLDFEAALDAGIVTAPGSADDAVLQLTAAEQQELVRLLRQELEQPGG